MTFHASITPNAIVAIEGHHKEQQLTVAFNCTGADKNAAELELVIFEAGQPDSFEKQRRPVTLVKMFGKLTNNLFETIPTKDGMPSVQFPHFDELGPVIEIKTNYITVGFGLPDADREHGVFELQLEVRRLEPRRPTFKSRSPTFVRSFKHYQVEGVPRPVIAFIATQTKDDYFRPAKAYWRHHADIVHAKPAMSLLEITQLLDRESKKVGPWGQVNIVTHGRKKQLQMKARPQSPKALMHEDLIHEEMSGVSVPAGGIDGSTQVVFRVCKAGLEQALVETIKSTFFSSAGFLAIPKFLEKYAVGGLAPASGVESFVEEIEFDIPGHVPLSEAEAVAKKEAAFKKLRMRSPGLSPAASPAEELPTFKPDGEHYFYQSQPLHLTALEQETVGDDGQPLSPDELADKLGRMLWQEKKLHTWSATWKSVADRWKFELVSKDAKKPPPMGIWMDVGGQGVTATPAFQVIGSGTVDIGSGSLSGLWKVQGDGIEAVHVRVVVVSVKAQSQEATVEVTLLAQNASATVGGATLAAPGASRQVHLPTTVSFGKAHLHVRRLQRFTIDLMAKRMFQVWRREMHEYVASKAYPDRPLVTPDLNDDRHFGKA